MERIFQIEIFERPQTAIGNIFPGFARNFSAVLVGCHPGNEEVF